MIGRILTTLFVTLAVLGMVFPIPGARTADAEMISSSPSTSGTADVKIQAGREVVEVYLLQSGCTAESAAGFAGALSPSELAFIADNPTALHSAGEAAITAITGVLLFILFIVLIFVETDTQEESGAK
ncbi:MAG: hypothetical protein RDV41_14390 [Planctomycetota bacterium]|nr:hypothetical protein [Planctomycetota bacterium]